MTKKHEELVEEIAGRIRHYKHFAEKRNPTASERIKASFDLAELFVTDTLSAVRDGLELPREVGRGEIVDGFMVDWDKETDEEPMGLNCRFIALRGTGKEEEI